MTKRWNLLRGSHRNDAGRHGAPTGEMDPKTTGTIPGGLYHGSTKAGKAPAKEGNERRRR